MLKPSGRSFYKASVPYPQVAGSPSRRTKNNTPLVELAKVWRGCRIAVVGVGASLRRLCATAIVHPCTSCLLCWFRIVPRQPFGSLHLCIDSHLCRCIVQRLCVAVFMHPCITTLCDSYRAPFARL